MLVVSNGGMQANLGLNRSPSKMSKPPEMAGHNKRPRGRGGLWSVNLAQFKARVAGSAVFFFWKSPDTRLPHFFGIDVNVKRNIDSFAICILQHAICIWQKFLRKIDISSKSFWFWGNGFKWAFEFKHIICQHAGALCELSPSLWRQLTQGCRL